MVYAYDNSGIIFAHPVRLHFAGNANCRQRIDAEEHFLMWHPHKDMLVFVGTDNGRIYDIIKYEIDVPTELTPKSLVEYYERICKALDKRGYTPKNERYNFNIIIADNKNAYDISGRGVVTLDAPLNITTTQFGR